MFKVTIKAPVTCRSRSSDVFIVNLQHISTPFSSGSVAEFEQVNVY